MSAPKVLIVCFTFPPYPGVGGRRWAKFAKYLFRKGCDIRVIAARKPEGRTSPWYGDTQEYRDRIEFIESGYPLILTTIPRTIPEKIRYRLALLYVKARVKGNFYDHSSLWGGRIVREVEKRIREGYNNVVVTCGPFRVSGDIITLKKKYPDVNFIVDFRDPWTSNKTSFGYTSIGADRLALEQDIEKNVCRTYDRVISVSDEMSSYFSALGASEKGKFLTVINGFDREDFVNPVPADRPSGKMRLVFTGTLYDRSMHVFEEFCRALADLQSEEPVLYGDLTVDFYGHVPAAFNQRVRAVSGVVNYRGEVPMEEVYRQLSCSDLAMLFLTDDLNYSFSTKFYEYISQKKPLIVFSIPGQTGNFVEKNRLGYACFTGSMKDKLKTVYADWKSENLRFNADFDTSGFDVEHITEHIIRLLK